MNHFIPVWIPEQPGVGTFIRDLLNPTGVPAEKAVDKFVKVANVGLESAANRTIIENTVPKSSKAAKAIDYLNKKRRAMEKTLANTPQGTKYYNRLQKSINSKITSVGNKTKVTTYGAQKSKLLKGAGKGLKFLLMLCSN